MTILGLLTAFSDVGGGGGGGGTLSLESVNVTLNVTEAIHTLSVPQDVRDVRLTIYVATAGFTVLVWDHFLTFADEIRFIWFTRKSALIYLFFIIRYFTPLSFIVNLYAYSAKMDVKTCETFVPYEGACSLVVLSITGIMMFLRIKALYADRPNSPLVIFTLLVLLTEIVTYSWFLVHSQAVKHNKGVFACTLMFKPEVQQWASSTAWLPLFYNTVILALTLWRCEPFRSNVSSQIVRNVIRDGILYYIVILSTNFVLTVMITSARDGLKYIAAQLAELLTAAMMSRITINIKRDMIMGPTTDEEDSFFHPTPPDATNTSLYFRHETTGNTEGFTNSEFEANFNNIVSQMEIYSIENVSSVNTAVEDPPPPSNKA